MSTNEMHEHNRDLVTALAEGSLEPSAVAAAEAEVASCDECSAELAAQQLAIEFLRATPPAALTELESARLRKSVRDDLGIAPPELAAPAVQKDRRWRGLSVGLSVAAVLVLFVAVLPALSLFGGGADSAAPESVVAFATTTTSAPAALDAPESAGAVRDTGPDDAEPAPTTGAAVAEAADGDAWVVFSEEPDLDAIRSLAAAQFRESGTIADLGSDLSSFTSNVAVAMIDEAVFSCFDEGLSRLGAGQLEFPIGSGVIDGTDVFVIAYARESTGEIRVFAHSVENCSILTSAG